MAIRPAVLGGGPRAVNRLLAFLIVALVLAAGVIGAMLADVRWPSPAILAAYAAQEQAKARQIAAAAAAAEYEARVLADAHPERVRAEQIRALGYGVAVAVVSVGGALALSVLAITWAWRTGVTVYPNADGHYPILVQRLAGGGVRVLDTSRSLAPLVETDGRGEVRMPLPASEMTALQLATQAQQAAVMIGVSKNSRNDYEMPERIGQAARSMLTMAQPAAPGAVRMVYVNDPRRAGRERAEMELGELREFIRQGWVIGLSRDKWLGSTFATTGRRCSKSYWMSLIDKLSRAQAIEPKPGGGYQPIVTVEAALETFGLSDQQAAVGQEPGGDDRTTH